ncbi:hypothetical protein PIB30_002698 [Stylosanthes scabra]|uniref:Ribonuclease H1 N-terminal domain-containing protein n=1 Tax=Stylosanthes scabra TaxID=79078 RepID=A0ABU6R361_9FABA|nr:hypothetical protein [Stylosanthes scabra]
MSRAKYSHYAVKIGRVPGIYLTSDECHEQVHGYPYSSFKGFKSLEETQKWLNKELGSGRGRSAAKSVEKLSPDFYSKIGAGASSGYAYQILVNSTQNASSCSYGASEGNAKGKTAVECEPEPDRGTLITEEEMELYLLRVCMKLHLGSPRFESSNEGRARNDTAYTLLEMLLSRTGHSICDYNYRRMCALQQQLEEIQGT